MLSFIEKPLLWLLISVAVDSIRSESSQKDTKLDSATETVVGPNLGEFRVLALRNSTKVQQSLKKYKKGIKTGEAGGTTYLYQFKSSWVKQNSEARDRN